MVYAAEMRQGHRKQERLFGKLSSYVNECPEASQVSFFVSFFTGIRV